MKKLRESKKLTQVELVAQMQVLGSKISRTTYNKIELGSRNIYVSDLKRLQSIYGVSFDEFFKD